MSARDLLEEALKLPAKERGQMVRELIRSLDAGEDDPAEVERAWAAELEDRVEAVRSGEVTARDGNAVCDDVLANLRARRK